MLLHHVPNTVLMASLLGEEFSGLNSNDLDFSDLDLLSGDEEAKDGSLHQDTESSVALTGAVADATLVSNLSVIDSGLESDAMEGIVNGDGESNGEETNASDLSATSEGSVLRGTFRAASCPSMPKAPGKLCVLCVLCVMCVMCVVCSVLCAVCAVCCFVCCEYIFVRHVRVCVCAAISMCAGCAVCWCTVCML